MQFTAGYAGRSSLRGENLVSQVSLRLKRDGQLGSPALHPPENNHPEPGVLSKQELILLNKALVREGKEMGIGVRGEMTYRVV